MHSRFTTPTVNHVAPERMPDMDCDTPDLPDTVDIGIRMVINPPMMRRFENQDIGFTFTDWVVSAYLRRPNHKEGVLLVSSSRFEKDDDEFSVGLAFAEDIIWALENAFLDVTGGSNGKS